MVDRRDGIDRRETELTISDVYQLVDGSHKRLREDMNAGFSELRIQIAEMSKRAAQHESRTTVIETERRMEAKQARLMGAIAGSVAGIISSAIFSLIVGLMLQWTAASHK
jgi:hypothetical protein